MSLAFLIQQAFDLPAFEVIVPESVGTRRYDIAATSGDAASPAEMRVMLRNLLIQRFHLTTHWDERTEPLYRLTVLPSGHKMKPTDQGYAIPNSPLRGSNFLQLTGPMNMRQLAERLTQSTGRPVLDDTGLEGYFRIELTFATDDAPVGVDSGSPVALLPAAVRDQLGLKLVLAKDKIQILVVDHADQMPVEN
jgi:uncharacterized protein (TIGR03435 family)